VIEETEMKLYILLLVLMAILLGGCDSKSETESAATSSSNGNVEEGLEEFAGREARKRIQQRLNVLPASASRHYWYHISGLGNDTSHYAFTCDKLSTCWDIVEEICGAKESDFRDWADSNEAKAPPHPNPEFAQYYSEIAGQRSTYGQAVSSTTNRSEST
jgi:hypothetical protein